MEAGKKYQSGLDVAGGYNLEYLVKLRMNEHGDVNFFLADRT